MNSGMTRQVVAGKAREGLAVEEAGQRHPAGLQDVADGAGDEHAMAIGVRRAIRTSIMPKISSVSVNRVHAGCPASASKPCTACQQRDHGRQHERRHHERIDDPLGKAQHHRAGLGVPGVQPAEAGAPGQQARWTARAAGRRSGPARVGSGRWRCAVKKSTMMLPRSQLAPGQEQGDRRAGSRRPSVRSRRRGSSRWCCARSG